MIRVLWIISFVSILGCRYEPEFPSPSPEQPEIKENRVPLIELEEFETDDHGWTYQVSDPRSRLKFEGSRTTDLISSTNHSLKIERLTNVAAPSEGVYDFADWKKSFTNVDVPFGAEIRLVTDIKLVDVSGTGLSLIINIKRQGVQVGYADSGWINGNGRTIAFSSYGTSYSEVSQPIDEIEVVLRMEPVTRGAVFFDNVELDILY